MKFSDIAKSLQGKRPVQVLAELMKFEDPEVFKAWADANAGKNELLMVALVAAVMRIQALERKLQVFK